MLRRKFLSNTVLVPPSVRKCVVTSSSSEITLQGDRNVIVVGGSSNTVVATSGRVIEIPKNMIPMDVGSLVVTQDGEAFGGTQVFVSNFSNTINVLGDDNLVFDTGALPLLSLLRLVTQRWDREHFTMLVSQTAT
jgi:DNA-binding beta-propeller fold protein YncE